MGKQTASSTCRALVVQAAGLFAHSNGLTLVVDQTNVAGYEVGSTIYMRLKGELGF